MRTGPFFLVLHLALASSASAQDLVVCGEALAADGSTLPPTARVELIEMEPVYDWQLRMLAGAEDADAAAVTTPQGGRYCLTAPEPGPWRVVVRAPGHVPMVLFPLAVVEPVELPPIRLSPDEGLEVRLPPGRPESGWVVAAPADRGYWAGRGGEGWRPELRAARVGAEDRIRVPRGPGEPLAVRFFPDGFASASAFRVDAAAESAAPPPLSPGTPRVIEIVDERGAPLPGVAVALADYGWPVAATDERGRSTLVSPPSGAVSLLLTAAEGRRLVTTLPPLSRDPDAAAESGRVRIVFPPTPAVRGRVLQGATRHPLPGALVWLAPDPGTHAVAGPEGEFALPGGGRPSVRIEAAAAEHLPRAIAAPGTEPAAEERQEIVLQPAGTATGRMVDEKGTPLAGVVLEARLEAPEGRTDRRQADASSRTRSGADGRFRLSGLHPAVRHRITASRSGLAARSLPGVVVPARDRRVDLGDLVLRPGTRLAGRVVDPAGRPIEGAEVRSRPFGGLPGRSDEERLRSRPPAAVAGPDGRFEVADLAAGKPVDLLVTASGHLPEWILGAEGRANEEGDPVTVVLARVSRLSGVVVDREGVPIPEATVGLRWEGAPSNTMGLEPIRPGSRSTETDRHGRFSFDEVPPGTVVLSSRPEGFLPVEAGPLTLPAGGTVDGVRLVLERGTLVFGTVFDPDGEPLEGVQLRVEAATVTSDRDGAFRLAGVPAGTWPLSAYHPDFRAWVRHVDTEPGDQEIDVHLEEGWSVSGRTVDEEGLPVAGARLELRPDRPDALGGYRSSSDDDGSFRIVVSREDMYRLSASHPDHAPGEVGGLEVGAGPVEGVEVVLARGASVIGRIVGLAPDELPGVRVDAVREDATGTVAGAVDPEGGYAVRHLAPGAWRVRAVLEGGRRQASATVLLDPGVGEVARDLEFGSGLRLGGRVLHRGEPIAGAHVQLLGLTASGERSVLTGHDGSFRIDDLAPGRYRLDVLDRNQALSHVEDLELSADRDLRLELESQPLAGAVSDAETGEPLPEATVTVRKALGASGELGPMIEMPTDAAGLFLVAHVTPGAYVVSARKDGYAPGERTVRVTEGMEPPPVSLRLAPTGGVTLTVHLAAGGVPRMATVSAFDGGGRLLVHDTRRVSDRGFAYYDQIPAGTWDLLVSAPGTAPSWVRAEVPDGRPQVVLPPAAPLVVRVPALVEANAAGTLTVVSESGQPFFQVDPAGEIRTRWIVHAGLLTLTDVPAGTWILRVDGAQGGVWTGTAATDGRSPAQATLE